MPDPNSGTNAVKAAADMQSEHQQAQEPRQQGKGAAEAAAAQQEGGDETAAVQQQPHGHPPAAVEQQQQEHELRHSQPPAQQQQQQQHEGPRHQQDGAADTAGAPVAETLLEWCRQGGVRWHGIQAGFVAEGWRGVLATQELPPGTCVLRVPRRLLLSVESARRDAELAAALQHCTASGVRLTSEQTLAAHLLHEASKGRASFWHPYLLSLPPHYTTLMCFSDQELTELQAPHAVAAAGAARAAAAAQHAGALPLLRALRLAPKWRGRAAWLWAASTLSSRTMYLPGDPAGALTPFGDLHNYRPPPPPFNPTPEGLLAAARGLVAASAGGPASCAAAAASTAAKEALQQPATGSAAQEAAASVAGLGSRAATTGADDGGALAAADGELAGDGSLDEATDEYRIFARSRYAPGEQVFLCYGRHSNLELLQHYGFVLADNPHDTAHLPAHLLPPAVRQQLAGEYGGPSVGSGATGDAANVWEEHALLDEAYLHANGAPSWGLLRALRLACAAPAERKAGACHALEGRPLSPASERAAFAALQAACKAALAALQSSLEEDEQELARLRRAAAAQGGAQQQQNQQQCLEQGQHAQGEQPSRRELEQAQWAAEKLCVALEWRLCHKRILCRGAQLCHAVLEALPQAPNALPAAAAQGDISLRLAALQRRPRW